MSLALGADHLAESGGDARARPSLAKITDGLALAMKHVIVAGVPVPVAMKITGHKTDSMFRRYAIVNEEQKREALAKTQEYLAASVARKVVAMGAAK